MSSGADSTTGRKCPVYMWLKVPHPYICKKLINKIYHMHFKVRKALSTLLLTIAENNDQ